MNPGEFKQTKSICSLASYAIAAEYLLDGKHNVASFLWAIACDGVARSKVAPPPGITVEQVAWASLFMGAVPWNAPRALQKVAWLHLNSPQRAFVDARERFSVTWIPAPFDANPLFDRHTVAGQWLACVAHQDPPQPDAVHAVCVGDDGRGIFRVETSFPSGGLPANSNGAERIAGWATLGSVRLDALLIHPTWT